MESESSQQATTPTGPSPSEVALAEQSAQYTLSFAAFMRAGWHVLERQPLVWGWHNDAMVEHLEAVTRGQIKKLAINVPPGSSKTLTVQVFWPAWEWITDQHPGGFRPDLRYIFATYQLALAGNKALLFARLVQSPWYQRLFGERWQADRKQWGQIMLGNVQGGWRLATSVEGAATGQHADRKVGDDLVKPQDILKGPAGGTKVALESAWTFWSQTMSSRNTGPNTAEVLMMQRLHELDPVGRIGDDPSWVKLCIPQRFEPKHPVARATVLARDAAGEPIKTWSDPRTVEGELMCPERFPEDGVRTAELTLGPIGFAAQHQQRPTPAGGAIYKREHFKFWQAMPREGQWVISVDATFKELQSSDYVAIHVWCCVLPNFYLIDRVHEQIDVLDTCQAIKTMRGKYALIREIWIEDKANGPAAAQILRREIPGIELINPLGGKVARANASAVYHRTGNVYVPDPARAPWVHDYIAEHLQFPMGPHDDDVDAQSQAINRLADEQLDFAKMVENMRAMGIGMQ